MPKLTYRCPLCGLCFGTKTSLIKHCLEEIKSTVQYKCSRCHWTKPEKLWDVFDGPKHGCFKEGKTFRVDIQHKTLDEIKALLWISREIHSREVDALVNQLDWRPPRNYWATKRKRASHKKDEPDQPRKMVVVINNSPFAASPSQGETPQPYPVAREKHRHKSHGSKSKPATQSKPVVQPKPVTKSQSATNPPKEVPQPEATAIDAMAQLLEEIGPTPDVELSCPPTNSTLDQEAVKELFPTESAGVIPPINSFLEDTVNCNNSAAAPAEPPVLASATVEVTVPVSTPPDTSEPVPASGEVVLPVNDFASVLGYDPANPSLTYIPTPVTATVSPASQTSASSSSSSSASASTTSNLPDLSRPYVRYPDSLLPYLPDCRKDIAVVALNGDTSYITTSSGEKYLSFPVWHRATGTLCFALAPARNYSEAAVFRDCPELAPYNPAQPDDLEWIKTIRHGISIPAKGTLLSPFKPALEEAIEKL